MANDPTRELIHKVNNLLSVIYTQAAVGQAATTLEDAQAALAHIQKAAEATVPFIQACRDAPRD